MILGRTLHRLATPSILLLALSCSGTGERAAPPPPAAPSPSPAVAPASPTGPSAPPASPAPSAPPSLPPRSGVQVPADTVVAVRVVEAPRLDGRLDDAAWQGAAAVAIDTDWRGAPSGPETVARLVWSEDAIFFSFDCAYEDLVVDDAAPTDTEHRELYRFDAVEVFLDPDPATPSTYVELEVGPRGHFLDIDVDRDRRPRGDVAWSSGMTVSTTVDAATRRYRIETRVPAAALGRPRLAPAELRIGLYRLAGRGDARRYLARFPTGTARPSFHVPERFGHLLLQERD